MAEKVIEVQYYAFTSPRESKLDIQGLETGLTRATLLTSSSGAEMVLAAENEAVTELKNRKV